MSEERPGYAAGVAATQHARAKLAALRSRLGLDSDDYQRYQALATACVRDTSQALAEIQRIKQDFPELADEPLSTSGLPVEQLIRAALLNGAAHHKQWYLEQIALALGIDPGEHEPGIAP